MGEGCAAGLLVEWKSQRCLYKGVVGWTESLWEECSSLRSPAELEGGANDDEMPGEALLELGSLQT